PALSLSRSPALPLSSSPALPLSSSLAPPLSLPLSPASNPRKENRNGVSSNRARVTACRGAFRGRADGSARPPRHSFYSDVARNYAERDGAGLRDSGRKMDAGRWPGNVSLHPEYGRGGGGGRVGARTQTLSPVQDCRR